MTRLDQVFADSLTAADVWRERPDGSLLLACMEAEVNVLGTLLMLGDTPRMYQRVALTDRDFFYAQHRWIFKAIGWMHSLGEQVDSLTVMYAWDRFRLESGAPSFREVGTRARLDYLVGACRPSMVDGHVALLKRARRARELRDALFGALECLERWDVEGALGWLVPAPENVVELRHERRAA